MLATLKPNKYAVSAVTIVMALILFNCKKEKPKVEEETTFPKQEMLINIADNVILPAYAAFDKSLDSLVSEANKFIAAPDGSSLNNLRTAYRSAYYRYQTVNLFGFGPAEDQAIRSNFNIFPTDTNQIRNNISSGVYNLASAANVAAKGFPAIDYLLFKGGDNNIVTLFADAKRGKYLSDLLADMSARSKAVINGWSTYRGTFVNSLGTDISSSIGYLVNQINYELDYLKNAKIGIPLGLKSDGQKLPEKCEAYYSGESHPYALRTLQVIEDTYLGRSANGSNGKGFDDYLEHLGSTRAGAPLHTAISEQFALARNKLTQMGGPVSDKVMNDAAAVQAAHNELVKLLVLLKTDMPSSLGVVITYQDGDGD